MKYFIIVSTMIVTGLFARATNPDTDWFYDQSTFQAFYMLENVSIDGTTAEGDGTGAPPNDGDCYTSGTCDVVGAFVDRAGTEVCVGWVYADASINVTTVPLMGSDGSPATADYLTNGESAYLKIYDSSNGFTLNVTPGDALPGFSNNGIFVISGTSSANNALGCTTPGSCNYDSSATVDNGSCWSANAGCTCSDAEGSTSDCLGTCNGSAVIDDCNDCDGNNAAKDCAGVCDGSSVEDGCGVCDADSGNDNISCTGCMNSDADDYDASSTLPGSCLFTVPGATGLNAQGGSARVYLDWTAPNDGYSNSSLGYTYHIYQDGVDVQTTPLTSTQVTGLNGDQNYCFTVLAVHNEYGASTSHTDEECAVAELVLGPTWRLQVKAEIDSYDQFQFSGYTAEEWILRDEQNFLGVAADASWGYDPIHDTPEPPTAPGNYVKLFFDHPEWNSWVTHYTEDIVLDDNDFFMTNLTQWNMSVQADVPGTVTIRFTVDIGVVPSDYEMYVELDGDYTRITPRAVGETETAIDFYFDGSGQQDLAVYIGNIPPQAPDDLTAVGNYSSIDLDWEADGADLNDIGNRYPALTYNIYRDDQPADPHSNDGNKGDCPGGSGGLIVPTTPGFDPNGGCYLGQTNTDYFDRANLYGTEYDCAACAAITEDFIDCGTQPDIGLYMCAEDGQGNLNDDWDPSFGNGLYDFGELFSDDNDNNKWDGCPVSGICVYADEAGMTHEGLLQESSYYYVVTGTNLAGESSEGHTVRLSGGGEFIDVGDDGVNDLDPHNLDVWNPGRGSSVSATTTENYDPISVPVTLPSPDGTNWFTVDGNDFNWEDGDYEIPHNFDKDANRIWIREGAWGSFDPDYPYGDFASFDYTWTKVSGDSDLSDIWGQQTSELSFTVSNAHEDYVGGGGHNTKKSYTWNLLIDSRHPWRVYENPTTNALDGTTYYAANGVWVEEDHGHSDDGNLKVTIYPEPNEDPIAADARDLPRTGDGKSVVTSDDYDNIAG